MLRHEKLTFIIPVENMQQLKLLGEKVSEFVVKDSGAREQYASGMVRDTQENKPDYTLLDANFLKRWAIHMMLGAKKYGRDNWRKANSLEEWLRFKASAFRHHMDWQMGKKDEDHAVATAFNMAAADDLEERLNAQQ